MILSGLDIAKKTEEEFIIRVKNIREKIGFSPILATILVGDDPASVTYVNMKKKACERIGLQSNIINLPSNSSTSDVVSCVKELNQDEHVVGVFIQHPMPSGIDERKCFDAISLDKDVDGLNSKTFGLMSMGENVKYSATPYGIMRILKHYSIPLMGKHAVVIGRSAILGKPIAMMLLNSNCTVTICHSKTENLPEIVKSADIVVACVGIPRFVKKDWLKPGVVLIDAGYNPGNIGDIDMDECKEIASSYTPVPGGVGPMTINSLLLQTVEAAEKQYNIN